MHQNLTRRQMIQTAGICCLGTAVAASAKPLIAAETTSSTEPMIALNTGTLMGFNLPIEQEIEVASQAGYKGIEVWMNKIQRFTQNGGKLPDLKKRFKDNGIALINVIAFAEWIVDDDEKRGRGVEQMKRDMEILAQLDCPYIAAPASGATGKRIDDLEECGKRYAEILEIGELIGVLPILELWGASATMSKLSDCVTIAIATGNPKASLLLDAYHLYRGGNKFESLTQISGKSLKVFHLNDYPADPPRERLRDSDRVYPGDGICPLSDILKTIKESGFVGALSLEIFNQKYWETGDPLSVAKTGYEKIRKILASE